MIIKAKDVTGNIAVVDNDTDGFNIEFDGDESIHICTASDNTIEIESTNGFGNIDKLIISPNEGRRLCIMQKKEGVLDISEV